MEGAEYRIAMHPQTESLFFGIPPELRNAIYKLVFQGKVFCVGKDPKWYPTRESSPQPATLPNGILLACKQAYYESVEMYYKTVTFRFEDLSHAFKWIGETIPKTYASLITRTIIHIDDSSIDWIVADKSEKRINRFYKKELKKVLNTYGVELKNTDVVVDQIGWYLGKNV